MSDGDLVEDEAVVRSVLQHRVMPDNAEETHAVEMVAKHYAWLKRQDVDRRGQIDVLKASLKDQLDLTQSLWTERESQDREIERQRAQVKAEYELRLKYMGEAESLRAENARLEKMVSRTAGKPTKRERDKIDERYWGAVKRGVVALERIAAALEHGANRPEYRWTDADNKLNRVRMLFNLLANANDGIHEHDPKALCALCDLRKILDSHG